MKCKICDNDVQEIFSAKVLNKHYVKYYHCDQCGFLQTEEPHWLKEAYNSPINLNDTGILERALMFAPLTAVLIHSLFNKKAQFLDYAGGYGVFVRKMRDMGFDFYWHDHYSPNLLARGFEAEDKNLALNLTTCFDAFEHFVEPIKEIEQMLKSSDNILFSQELLPEVIPQPGEWWYYAPEHGQHVSFYAPKTLNYIAQKYDLTLHSYKGLHLLTKNKNIASHRFRFVLKCWGAGFIRSWMSRRALKKMQSLTITDMEKLTTRLKGSG